MKLTAKINIGSDATTAYDVTEYKAHTAADFVGEVLTTHPSEWGDISIVTTRMPGHNIIRYKEGKLLDDISQEWLDITINKIDCSGGWGRMDYRIFPEVSDKNDNNKENGKKSPFSFDILNFVQNKFNEAVENKLLDTKPIPAWLYNKLELLGIIPNDVRDHNVGSSDYAHHIIQPWAIWKDYRLNAWDADIVKRVLRRKETESRISDYKKIIHDCQERIRQLEVIEKQAAEYENDEKPIRTRAGAFTTHPRRSRTAGKPSTGGSDAQEADSVR